jgi:hypothetical protein
VLEDLPTGWVGQGQQSAFVSHYLR